MIIRRIAALLIERKIKKLIFFNMVPSKNRKTKNCCAKLPDEIISNKECRGESEPLKIALSNAD